ncbi:MAG: hypothetical protein ACYCST_16105 [Acidimicrobiales bacterium]
MTRRRLGELARGVGGFVGLVVLVVGVGWPLPHEVPTLSALHRLFTGRYHRNGLFYLKVVAIVAWIAWLEVAACAVAEIRAVVAGRRAWQVRFAGPLLSLISIWPSTSVNTKGQGPNLDAASSSRQGGT